MQNLILLQAGSGNAGLFNLIFFGLILLVFWLFIIRPQAKRQREQNQFLDQLERGQEVVTASGLIGRINKIENNVVTLETGTKTFIKVVKSAVSKEMTEQLYGKEKKKGPVEGDS